MKSICFRNRCSFFSCMSKVSIISSLILPYTEQVLRLELAMYIKMGDKERANKAASDLEVITKHHKDQITQHDLAIAYYNLGISDPPSDNISPTAWRLGWYNMAYQSCIAQDASNDQCRAAIRIAMMLMAYQRGEISRIWSSPAVQKLPPGYALESHKGCRCDLPIGRTMPQIRLCRT